MSKEDLKSILRKDFEDFRQSRSIDVPPPHLNIHQNILEKMSPSQGVLLLKMAFIHLLMGIITLTFCPQFSLSLTGSYHFFHMIHSIFGHGICLAICGAVFMTPGILAARFIFSLDEWNAIRRSHYLHLMILTAFFLILFLMIGGIIYLEAALLWIIGAILGSSSLYHGLGRIKIFS